MIIKAHAAEHEESLTGFINRSIAETVEHSVLTVRVLEVGNRGDVYK